MILTWPFSSGQKMVVKNAIFLGRAEFLTLADLIEISGIEAVAI
jgi:hypothetical protein